jgi:hypothetical protein
VDAGRRASYRFGVASGRRIGYAAFALATAAVVWTAGFTWWALTAPAYSDGETILQANPETLVRIAVGTPLASSMLAWVLLHIACRRGSTTAHTAGLVLASLLVIFSFVTGFSIGLLVLPGAVALSIGAAITPVAES